MSMQMKGFFEHPFVVLTRKKSTKPQIVEPLSFEEQREYLFRLKVEEIASKRSQLEGMNSSIERMQETLNGSSEGISLQQAKLETILEELKTEERQKEMQLTNCQEIESIDPEEFRVWREESARVTHKLKIRGIKQEYENIRDAKNKELQELKDELWEIRNEQNELSLKLEMLKGEEPPLIKRETPPQSEDDLPDTQKVIEEISVLREKIQQLQETNINLINMVKEELDSTTWGVKDKFEQSRDRIQKEMKRLLNYLENPNKQVIRKVQNPDRIAQPITLIEDYENRLMKIEQSLPPELREDRILKCLRPLPWKLIKGVSFQPSSNNCIQQKFQMLTTDFTQAQQSSRQYKSILAQREAQLQQLSRKIQECEHDIRQAREQL